MSTALITGATQGLGRALAGALAARGWDLVVTARNASRLAETVSDLRGHGHDVVGLAGDVSDAVHRDEVAHVVTEIAGTHGLDLLVHNASTLGPVPLRPPRDLSAEDLAAVLSVNVVAPQALTRSLLPTLEAVCARDLGDHVRDLVTVDGIAHVAGEPDDVVAVPSEV